MSEDRCPEKLTVRKGCRGPAILLPGKHYRWNGCQEEAHLHLAAGFWVPKEPPCLSLSLQQSPAWNAARGVMKNIHVVAPQGPQACQGGKRRTQGLVGPETPTPMKGQSWDTQRSSSSPLRAALRWGWVFLAATRGSFFAKAHILLCLMDPDRLNRCCSKVNPYSIPNAGEHCLAPGMQCCVPGSCYINITVTVVVVVFQPFQHEAQIRCCQGDGHCLGSG